MYIPNFCLRQLNCPFIKGRHLLVHNDRGKVLGIARAIKKSVNSLHVLCMKCISNEFAINLTSYDETLNISWIIDINLSNYYYAFKNSKKG